MEKQDLLKIAVLQFDTFIQICMMEKWLMPEESAFFLFDSISNLLKKMLTSSHEQGAKKENIRKYMEENLDILKATVNKYINELSDDSQEIVVENPTVQ